MDSRSKIVAADRLPKAAILVTGYFDVIQVEHARQLGEIRKRAAERPVTVVVLARQDEIVPLQARAEVVAALHMVDYVVTAHIEDVNRLIESSEAAEVVRLETSDEARTGRLMDHVQRSQIR